MGDRKSPICRNKMLKDSEFRCYSIKFERIRKTMREINWEDIDKEGNGSDAIEAEEVVIPYKKLAHKPEVSPKDIAAFKRNAGMLKTLGLYDLMEDLRRRTIEETDNKKLWGIKVKLELLQKYLDLYKSAGKIAQEQSALDLSDAKVSEITVTLQRTEEEE